MASSISIFAQESAESGSFDVNFNPAVGLVINKSDESVVYAPSTVNEIIIEDQNDNVLVSYSNNNGIKHTDGQPSIVDKYLIKNDIAADGTYKVILKTNNPNLESYIGTYSVEIKPSLIPAMQYPEGTNASFGLKDGDNFQYYYVRGLSEIVANNTLYVKIGNKEYAFYKDQDGDFSLDKGSVEMYVPKGQYVPTVSYGDYETLSLGDVDLGLYRDNKIVPHYVSQTKEMELDFSAFDEGEREELMKLFLEPSYNPEINRDVYINAVRINNTVVRNGDLPIYRDGNSLFIKAWAIDMVKQNESSYQNNGGFVSIEGYTNVQLGNFEFVSSSPDVQIKANIFKGKDYIYLDIDCGNRENRDKVLLLRNIGVSFTKQIGVGVGYLTINDLNTMGAVSYPGDSIIRIQLNTEGGMNGFIGYNVVFEGMYGIDVNCEAKFVVAPVPSKISSSMTLLSDVALERGWPRFTNQDPQHHDNWKWVDGSQLLETGSYKARIEVWDYEGSEYLTDLCKNNGIYVDYESLCKNVDNVEYIVEDGHHYLEATIQIVKPESVGGYETSVVNFDPNNKDDYYATYNKTSVTNIDSVLSNDGKTSIDYYDITLGGGTVTSIENAGEFTVVIPGWVNETPVEDGKTREYSVVTYHNGETRTLPAVINSDGTLTFKSKDFSTFAIAFKDTARNSTNAGGSSSSGSSSSSAPVRKPVVNTCVK